MGHLRRVRLDRGVWQKHVAAKIGCSAASLTNWGKGNAGVGAALPSSTPSTSISAHTPTEPDETAGATLTLNVCFAALIMRFRYEVDKCNRGSNGEARMTWFQTSVLTIAAVS